MIILELHIYSNILHYEQLSKLGLADLMIQLYKCSTV